MSKLTKRHVVAAVLVTVSLCACVTFRMMQTARHATGIKPLHTVHAKEGLSCTDCHQSGKNKQPIIPGHDICSACHEFDLEKPDERCAFCHTRPDYKVTIAKPLNPEIKFDHGPHTAAGVKCETCHPHPDKSVLPAQNIGLMEFCMDCHASKREYLTNCFVCHKELTKNVKPKYRAGVRLPHDSRLIWETIHGRESKRDEAYCRICHEQSFCEDCHTKNPPRSHMIAWRGKPHGLHAQWNRQKCTACHDEDSCVKCHRHTQPNSHHAGWGGPLNRHCIKCHYPPRNISCTACHENIDHPKAFPSPHEIGLFPVPCGLCHPGGIPFRSPHIMNTSIPCRFCH